MLRFNNTVYFSDPGFEGFQYILCYGSTSLLKKLLGCSEDFNTSYVTVQLQNKPINFLQQENFNTSYVTVQQRSV